MSRAGVTRSDDVQDLAWIGGSVHHVLLDGAKTEGRLTVLRSHTKGGAGSPVHVHERDDETVLVLSGTLTFWVGRETFALSEGDSVFLPRGVPHTYAITSDAAELVTICNPAGMEDFFRAGGWDLSRPLPQDWRVDLARVQQAADATDQILLGPPLQPGEAMPENVLGRG